MIRELYDPPAVYDPALLTHELRLVLSSVQGVNTADGDLAVYSDDPQNREAMQAVVDAHVPPPFPSLDGLGVLCALLVVEGVLTADDAANAAGVSTAHLEHEALAWGVA